jgi:hypothetical protein
MMGRSMVGRKLFLAVAFSCGAFLGMAQGQQTQELTAIIGRTIISDHGVTGVSTFDPILHSGKGLSLELNYAHKLKSMELFSFAVEVPVLFNFKEQVHFSVNQVPKDYKSIFVTPSLRVNFAPQIAISPWVSVGGGYGHFSYNSSLEFIGSNPGPGSSNTGIFQIGGGIDVRAFRWAKLRAEVRDFYSGVPDLNVTLDKSRQHNLFAGGGFVFLF